MFAYSIIYRVFPKDRMEIVSRILPIRVDKLQDLDFWKPSAGLPTYIAVFVSTARDWALRAWALRAWARIENPSTFF